MKLTIIGNGFDLHHGFKTSFSHFRDFLKISQKESDVKLYDDINSIIQFKKKNSNSEFHWNEIENMIGGLLKDGSISIDGKSVVETSEKFTARFYEYIKEENQKEIAELNPVINLELSKSNVIINFNYTNFYEKYLINPKTPIFHIHGKLAENNLPIIGFFYDGLSKSNSTDYAARFQNKVFHKPALAYKQNEIDLDRLIDSFSSRWSNKILEVVVIGYSFGPSDIHIYKILDTILVTHEKSINTPKSKADRMPIIKFKIFNYDPEQSELLINKIKESLKLRCGRNCNINVSGVGISTVKKELITFELIDY